MKYGAGLHVIVDDLGLVESEPGFPTSEEYRQWREGLTNWLDRAEAGLQDEVNAYVAKRVAFSDFLRARGDEAPI